MKAVEFIAKFGWELAQRDVVCLETGSITKADFLNHYGFEILDDLKHYVDAYELIKKLGSIQAAKDTAYQNTMNVDGFDPSKIESAIALVEEVEKFKGVA